MYRFIVGSFVLPLICLFGLTGNCFGLIVIWREMQTQHQSTFKYMFALIVLDNELLLTGLIHGIFYALSNIVEDLMNILITFLEAIKLYFDFLSFHSSSALLILMAIERLNATAWPLKCKESLLARYPKRIIFLLFAMYAVLILPLAVGFELKETFFNGTTTYSVQVRESTRYYLIKFLTIEAAVCFLYSVVLIVTNAAIVINYILLQRRRLVNLPCISSRQDHKVRVTLLVCWISIMYILNISPRIIHHTLTMADDEYTRTGAKRYTLEFLQFSWDICTKVNAANDFCIYFLLYKRFRNMFCSRLLRKQRSTIKDSGRNSAHTYTHN